MSIPAALDTLRLGNLNPQQDHIVLDMFPTSSNSMPPPPPRLPVCDCDMYMPVGEHDPLRHRPEYGGSNQQEYMIQADARAKEEALLAERRALDAEREAQRVKEVEVISTMKSTSLRSEITVQAGIERRKLLETPQESSLHKLSVALQQQSREAVFTCGGRLPIITHPRRTEDGHLTPRTETKVQSQTHLAKPVTIRWGGDGLGRLLSLPAIDAASQATCQQLIESCVPATFGRDGHDVYDESYRRAGALSTSDFLTDFCPYEAGIIDIVAQLLLPPEVGDLRMETEHGVKVGKGTVRGLRAELYKLNVYSGPSGLFKPHVDTPRGATQVGSLVVCLPVSFEGGELAVRHQGHEVKHDWADSPEPAIQWAAFYSDCEHEVLEVTSGHRITLTYNLFLSAGTGLLNTRAVGSMQPETLPLTQHLKRFLETADAMPKGGHLGIRLVHAYPHTNKRLHSFVPNMLKGADMAVYEAIIAAGLYGILAPLRLVPAANTFRDLNALSRSNRGPVGVIDSRLEALDVLDQGDPEERGHDDEFDIGTDSDFELKLNALDDGDKDSDWDSDEQWQERFDSSQYEAYNEKELEDRLARRADRQIVWLNRDGNREISRVFMAYGNEAELAVQYNHVALVVKVPSWEKRKPEEARNHDDVIVIDD